jgi:hypothetical protein
MEKSILMGITTYRQVPAPCLAHHIRAAFDAAKYGYTKRVEVEHDMYVTLARNKIAANALDLWHKKEITHLLYVDDDVQIPLGGIRQLADADVPAVSALYFTREFLPTAYSFVPEFHQLEEVPEGEGLWQVDAAGAGALLIDCAILQEMKDKYKSDWWFLTVLEKRPDGTEHYLGEDVFFFKRLKEMGIPLSIHCGVRCDHMGTGVTNYQTYEWNRKQKTKK